MLSVWEARGDRLIHHRGLGGCEGEGCSARDSPSFAVEEGGTCSGSLERKGH